MRRSNRHHHPTSSTNIAEITNINNKTIPNDDNSRWTNSRHYDGEHGSDLATIESTKQMKSNNFRSKRSVKFFAYYNAYIYKFIIYL